MRVQVYDTTLRDGTQREGISLSCDDKLRIARRLDDLGVAFIEGGWPGSNPKDVEFFSRAKDIRWNHAVITSFGSTCRVGGRPGDDPNIGALIDSSTSVCALVGKTSMFHVREVLRTNAEENLRIIRESTAYLVQRGRRVFYDAEHFFDGFKLDSAYALETLRAAATGGAEILVLCDTNGGTMPWEIAGIVSRVREATPVPLGIHTHNDAECAVANSLAAVREGCIQVQGTINGYGERCGNANLISVIADLTLKLDRECLPEGNLERLTDTAHYVAEIANLSPDSHLAYVGKSAFAHKGGIHVAAIRRNPDSYQHCDPALVGNAMRVVVSELSGRANLVSKSEEFGFENVDTGQIGQVLDQIKALEAKGFSF
jgi:2-isopropylmalate synthase